MKLTEPPAIEKIAEKFGLRQETLSRMTGFSLRSVAGWSNGKAPSAPVRRALVEMDRLLDNLARLHEAERRWPLAQGAQLRPRRRHAGAGD